MHVAAASVMTQDLLPALHQLAASLHAKAQDFAKILKIGRTHMQDATPITLGQEFSGYAAMVALAVERIEVALPSLYFLAQGGTAVGTGLNAHKGFAEKFAHELARETGLPFKPAENFFEALASHDALVFVHGALEAAATGLFKIASDIRLAGSGPRAGLGELVLPQNEPGSSIMPGKVNPTQVEALTMVCARVFGNQATIAFAASQGQFELNVFKPVIAFAFVESARLLAGAARSFAVHCVEGIAADAARLEESMRRSLMLVTALRPGSVMTRRRRSPRRRTPTEPACVKKPCASVSSAGRSSTLSCGPKTCWRLERNRRTSVHLIRSTFPFSRLIFSQNRIHFSGICAWTMITSRRRQRNRPRLRHEPGLFATASSHSAPWPARSPALSHAP